MLLFKNSDHFVQFSIFIDLGGVCHFQHCTGHIMTGSFVDRGYQYIQLVKVLYCKLPTISKQLPTLHTCRVRNLKFARNLKFTTSKTLVNFMKKMMFLSKNWYFSVKKALIYYTVNKSHHNSFILLVFSHVANFRYVANFRFLTLLDGVKLTSSLLCK